MGLFSRKPKDGETAERVPSKIPSSPKPSPSKFTKEEQVIIDKLNGDDIFYCADCGEDKTFDTPRELLEHKKKVHGINMMHLLKAVESDEAEESPKPVSAPRQKSSGSKIYEISIFFISGENLTMGDCDEKELADLERELKDFSMPFFEMRCRLLSKRNIERVDVEELEE